MKKSFSILIMFVIMAAFASLAVFIFEIKAMKSQNIKNEYLQIQGNLHLQFLSQVAPNLEDSDIQSLVLQEGLFELKIVVLEQSYELYVQTKQHNIRLHKSLIK